MKKRFKKRAHVNEEMNLQITSMADVFTIILVFLMKSYATGALNIEPAKGITLPAANITSQQDAKDLLALRVEISDSVISVGGKPVTRVTDFVVPAQDIAEGGAIRSLSAALPKGDAHKVMVIADQRAPYATVKAVLASAAGQGYTHVKLAVAHE